MSGDVDPRAEGDRDRLPGASGAPQPAASLPPSSSNTTLEVELEHGIRDPDTNVSNDDEITTGKIALAHLNEFPDYYTRLAEMEAEAERYWAARREDPAG